MWQEPGTPLNVTIDGHGLSTGWHGWHITESEGVAGHDCKAWGDKIFDNSSQAYFSPTALGYAAGRLNMVYSDYRHKTNQGLKYNRLWIDNDHHSTILGHGMIIYKGEDTVHKAGEMREKSTVTNKTGIAGCCTIKSVKAGTFDPYADLRKGEKKQVKDTHVKRTQVKKDEDEELVEDQ